MMSDHLCSMNETLSKQREEIDTLKMSSKVCGEGCGDVSAAGRRGCTVVFPEERLGVRTCESISFTLFSCPKRKIMSLAESKLRSDLLLPFDIFAFV